MLAQKRFQVGPRRIDPLGGAPLEIVEDMVEDRQAEVAHADFVDVGEGEGDASLDRGRVVLDDAPRLAAEVAGGAVNQG